MARKLALLAALCLAAVHPAAAKEAHYARARAAMVEAIRGYAQARGGIPGADGIAETILDAMARTPRHLFVPERYRPLAYRDGAVPIGHGQTISQPFVVALMTQLAQVGREDTALEIGTGSGYQAAILAQLARKVCTIEIVRPLGEAAAKQLAALGHDNVTVRIGDGYKGWPECGPFDAIIVTAALGHVPAPLIEQLKTGGRLVMPVGPAGATQHLTVVEKTPDGKTETRTVGLVRFVPFTREED